MKKLALVLGGGSSKGYAHIGVLKALEKNGIKPDIIVGTSMGALVGGFYCAGISVERLEDLAEKFNSLGPFSLYSALFKDNLLNVDKVKRLINKELKDKTHDECDIKFVSVSTELNLGKEYHFDSGLLRESVLASISIPGVFPRFKKGENVFVDGGLLNNLPEDVAKEYMPDAVIISVDVIGDYSKQIEKQRMKTVETIMNATTLMTQTIMNSKPKLADLRIEISQPNVSQMDFSKKSAQRAIHKGASVTRQYIAKIKQLLRIKDDQPKKAEKPKTVNSVIAKDSEQIKSEHIKSKGTNGKETKDIKETNE